MTDMGEMHQCVRQLGNVLRPLLHAYVARLRAAHPEMQIDQYEGPVGESTEYQGYQIGIDCTVPGSGDLDTPTSLALEVSVKRASTMPEIDAADVAWGHPSGYVEAALLDEAAQLSERAIQDLVAGLPRLLDAMDAALVRGRPR